MNRTQIENLYKVNGIDDYKLKGTDDLLKTHRINYKAVNGYNQLDDLNRKIYERFIINIFNAFGLESRATLVPKGIYYAEQEDYLYKDDPEDDYYIVIGGAVYTIDKNGSKSVLRTWTDEDYKDKRPEKKETSNYLRFEYEHEGRPEWLHVINDGKEWY